MPRKSWFSIEAKAGGTAEIVILDEIGMFGVTAADFHAALKAAGDVKRIDLRVNSPGGDVFAGMAMHTMLARHPARVVATVDGIAASIASVVVMAADEITMPASAFLMLHNPSGFVTGGADDLRDLADVLDKVCSSMAGIYAARSGRTEAEVHAIMAAETWLTGTEAVELGFADKVVEPHRIAALAGMGERFPRAPQALRLAAKLAEVTAPRASADDAGLQALVDATVAARLDEAVQAKLGPAIAAAVDGERQRVLGLVGQAAAAIAGNPTVAARDPLIRSLRQAIETGDDGGDFGRRALDILADHQSPEIRNSVSLDARPSGGWGEAMQRAAQRR